MSSNYYFQKWRKTVNTLKDLVEHDIECQVTKIHDREWCDAVNRLSSMLSRYIVCYNDAAECLEQNLQIQKTCYINSINKHILRRILELKHQLRKLEGCYYHFLTDGLIDSKLTTYDVEITNIFEKFSRPKSVQVLVEESFQKANDIQEILSVIPATEVSNDTVENNWWEEEAAKSSNDAPQRLNITAIYEVTKIISEETLKRRTLIALIQAHEKARQITRMNVKQKLKREMWKKELLGTLKPQARLDLRERAAKMIERFLRTYFELKRKRFDECRRDEILGLRLCHEQVYVEIEKERKIEPINNYEVYKEECKTHYEKHKKLFIEKHGVEIAEDLRDYIREWFYNWFVEAKYFLEIPKENKGGCVEIINEKVLTPSEWLDKYKAKMEKLKANKNKTALQIKHEKEEAKQEKLNLKNKEVKKSRAEEILKRNIMKNPNLHPGYNYPISKTTEHLQKEISIYLRDWFKLDEQEICGTKERCVLELNSSNAIMDAKIEMCKHIDNDMRLEYKLLMNALKKDYKNNEQEMPAKLKEKNRHKKKRAKKIKTYDDGSLVTKLTYLIEKGFIVQYPCLKFGDFCGDSNYAGNYLRCLLHDALPFGGETRAAWWEHCLKIDQGSRTLLVGAHGTDKTKLVYIAASIHDAVLYVLDPAQIDDDKLTPLYLDQLVNFVASCARVTQPSIIYLRHVHRLFYAKVPPGEEKSNLELIKRYFIRMLFTKIKKHEKIMIIGSCVDPWLTRSKQLIKKFPSVFLLPDTSYSAVSLILRNWVLRNRIVPPDLDVQSLAYALQGYPVRYLVETLHQFLTPVRIVRIAAHGLKAIDIYNYILENSSLNKIDYQKYLKWYNDRTSWGKIEQKKLKERREFKLTLEKFNDKMKKNSKRKQK